MKILKLLAYVVLCLVLLTIGGICLAPAVDYIFTGGELLRDMENYFIFYTISGLLVFIVGMFLTVNIDSFWETLKY